MTLTLYRSSAKSKKKQIPVNVITLEGELHFSEQEKILGRELLELVCRTLGIRETHYFGLRYVDDLNYSAWIKPEKRVFQHKIAQLKLSDRKPSLLFLAKFFPEEVSEDLIQDITRHFFFLQTELSIISGEAFCSPEEALFMASLALQAKYGDVELLDISLLPHPRDLLPERVLTQIQYTEEQWRLKLHALHAERRGLSREEAELDYLKLAQNLEMFGISYFGILNKKDTRLSLGVHTQGLSVYKEDRLKPNVHFMWSEIKNVQCSGRQFRINLTTDKRREADRARSLQQQQSSSQSAFVPSFVFQTQHARISKVILDLCVGNHELYMARRWPDSMEVQRLKEQTREDRHRRQLERLRYERKEEILRRDAAEERNRHETEKKELETRLQTLQTEFERAQEALTSAAETAGHLSAKVQLTEHSLTEKSASLTAELDHARGAARRLEEENTRLVQHTREAAAARSKALEDAKQYAEEASILRDRLQKSRFAEDVLRKRLQELLNAGSGAVLQNMTYAYVPVVAKAPPQHNSTCATGVEVSNQPVSQAVAASVALNNGVQNFVPNLTKNVPADYNLAASTAPMATCHPKTTSAASQTSDELSLAAASGSNLSGATLGNGSAGSESAILLDSVELSALSAASVEQNIAQVEAERARYLERSITLEERLKALRAEMAARKLEEKQTREDKARDEAQAKGETKYSTLKKSRAGTAKARVNVFEEL